MTATPATDTATLTPARKRLIRQSFTRYAGVMEPIRHLRTLPSFAGIALGPIATWAHTVGAMNANHDNAIYRARPLPPAVTQATAAPADPDPGTTGEWYTALAIAKGLGIGVERVYGWRQFGWLCGGPLYTAENIRQFVRAHPLEIKPRYLSDESWLWLVSVLAGSRESEATA